MGKKDISQEQTFFPCRYRRNQSNQTNFVFLPFFLDLLGNLQVFAEIIKIKKPTTGDSGFYPRLSGHCVRNVRKKLEKYHPAHIISRNGTNSPQKQPTRTSSLSLFVF